MDKGGRWEEEERVAVGERREPALSGKSGSVCEEQVRVRIRPRTVGRRWQDLCAAETDLVRPCLIPSPCLSVNSVCSVSLWGGRNIAGPEAHTLMA